jgi:hypothetical protein
MCSKHSIKQGMYMPSIVPLSSLAVLFGEVCSILCSFAIVAVPAQVLHVCISCNGLL